MGLLKNVGNGFTGIRASAAEAAPGILVGFGIAGAIASGVLACMATLKADEVIESTKEELEKIETVVEEHPEEYTEEDKKKDTAIVYAKAAGNLARLYAIPVGLAVLSTIGIVKSHGMMKAELTEVRNKNVALAATCGTLYKGFQTYRSRVRAELGEEADHHFMYGTERTEWKEDVVDLETGETHEETHDALSIPTDQEMYGRWFDRTSPYWENNLSYNTTFLQRMQELFNERLNARKHVFLNEVYDALGLPRTPEGQCVGWLKDGGVGYIDFMIWGLNSNVEDRGDYYVVRKLPNGSHVKGPDIFLDFNVDGVIIDKI